MALHEVIHQNLKFYGDIGATGLLGFILWFGLYGCFFYWKEFYITYYKHKDDSSAGYIVPLREMRNNVKNMVIFSIIIIAAFMLVSNSVEIADKVLFPGWILFIVIYLGYNIYKYLIKKDDFDYFDDFKFIYYYSLKPINKGIYSSSKNEHIKVD
jgi:hypothetical protein